jgi:hypothetical protein
VEFTGDRVIARQLFGRKVIPLKRITSVERSGLARIKVEAGAETHGFMFWSPGAAARMVEAIEDALTNG